MKRKIVICGGGVAGLSAATSLSDDSSNEVHLYEVNDRLGGQSSSIKSDIGYTETSWRIYGDTYHNINQIINKMQIDDNFQIYKKFDGNIVIGNNVFEGSCSVINLFLIFLNNLKLSSNTINKLINICFLCKDRAINSYHDRIALNYFNNDSLVKVILGGYAGMDPEKASLSTFFNVIRCTVGNGKYFFTPKNIRTTRNSSNDSFFDPWCHFLEKRGVKIHNNSELKEI